jgi:1-acyl-sn-glycerol-3-phosphate acyltransferase
MLIFGRHILINKPEYLKNRGPLLLASNHPNSFLDAVILLTLFDRPIHSLARGDVFAKPFYIRLLTAVKILPVFRTSEGPGNLNINYQTFEICKRIFRKSGTVLIFSEGQCVNEWHLRPLKKGTARLAFSSWEENIDLAILPVAINYSSFRRFGKNIFINFGEPITKNDFNAAEPDGKRNRAFTKKLEEELRPLVFEIGKKDIEKQKRLLEKKPSAFEKFILFLPALIGWSTRHYISR